MVEMAVVRSTTTLRPAWAGAGAAVLIATIALALPAMAFVVTVPLAPGAETVLARVTRMAYIVGFATLSVTGGVLLHRHPGAVMGRLLGAAGLAQLLTTTLMGAVGMTVLSGAPTPDLALWATNWTWVPAQLLIMLVLLRFPDGRLPGRGWRAAEGAMVAWAAVATAATAFHPGPLGSTALEQLDNPLGWDALRPIAAPLLSGLFLLLPLLNMVAALALLARWRRSGAADRQRLRWVACAAGATALAAPLVLLGTDSAEAPLALAALVLPASIAVAVLRRRLWELGAVAHTAVSAGCTAALLLGAFAAALRTLPGDWVPPTAGLAVAVAAIPVYRIMRRVLGRFLLGTNGDPERVVDTLRSLAHSSAGDPFGSTAAELARTLRLPWVAFEGSDGTAMGAYAEPPADARATLVTPLLVGGAEIGRLLTAERVPGEGLSPRDLAVLARVAEAAAPIAQAVGAERRLSTVRREERARLQRDLHDGLGAVLGGITLRAEAAQNLVEAEADPQRVAAHLARIGEDAQGAVAEIRRLLHQLRPTTLGEDGLATALRQSVAEHAGELRSSVSLDLPEALDSRVEVAAFRIVVEAVRNAARHSHAGVVSVDARIEGSNLALSVVDDGCGLAGSVPGVGVRAMKERAAELGGVLVLESPPGGGCRVRATLPCHPGGAA